MKLTQVEQVVRGLPFMTIGQAERLTTLMLDNGCTRVLELGIMHGVSTCYLAAALDGTGRDWSITSIDNMTAIDRKPNVEQLLDELGLRERVTVHYETSSYIWRLMKLIEEHPEPIFDLCYLDGAHNWPDDGFAFFLVDRLLRPGGWIVLDDIDWSYATSPALSRTDFVTAMPEEQRTMQQVRKVFDLLVKRHPSYGEFSVSDGWGFAQKLATAGTGPVDLRREYVTKEVGLGAVALKGYQKVKQSAQRLFARA